MSKGLLVCTGLVFFALGCSNARLYWQSDDPAYQDERDSCLECDSDYGVLDDQPADPIALLGLWTYQVEGSHVFERGTLEFFETAHGLSGRLTQEQQTVPMSSGFDEVHLAGNYLTFAGRAGVPGGPDTVEFRVEAEVYDWGRFSGRLSLKKIVGGDGIHREEVTIEARRRY